jgi:hypothetical protein
LLKVLLAERLPRKRVEIRDRRGLIKAVCRTYTG